MGEDDDGSKRTGGYNDPTGVCETWANIMHYACGKLLGNPLGGNVKFHEEMEVRGRLVQLARGYCTVDP